MKTFTLLIFSYILLFFSQSGLNAQDVRMNADRVIEVDAQEVMSRKAIDDQILEQVTDFNLYSIDIARLRRIAKQEGNQVKLNLNFSDQTAWQLQLQVNNLRAPDFRMVASDERGERELRPRAPHTYGGTNEAGDMVRINITKSAIWGYVKGKNEILNILPLREIVKGADPNTFVVCKSQDVIAFRGKTCGNVDDIGKNQIFDPGSVYHNSSALMTVNCAVAEMATEADFEYFQDFGSDAIAANQNIEGDFNLIEGLYQDEIGLTFSLVFQNVWTTSNDPYDGTGVDILEELALEWEANRTNVRRDLVHLFSGKNHGTLFGRVLALGAVCAIPVLSYGFSTNTSFSYSVLGHEIGHNFNAQHSDADNCWILGVHSLMCASPPYNLTFSSTNRNNIINHINANSGCVTDCCPITWDFPTFSYFENSLGPHWTQDPIDDANWIRNSGGTASPGTGPSGAYEGSYYMYLRATLPTLPYGQANLVSSCLDLSNQTGVALTFAYHMLGTTMGALRVQISEDNGLTWTTLWAREGNQGEDWLTAYVPLPTDPLGVVQLRFNATKGSSWSSDIAIDEVRIGRGCDISASPPFFEFDVNGGSASTLVVPSGEAWEISDPSLYPWLTVNPTSGNGSFNQTVNITVAPNGTTAGRAALMSVRCGLSGASSLSVVQAGQAINVDPCAPPYANIPAAQSFETNVIPWVQDSDDDLDWTRTSSATPSTGTGPAAAFEGNFYLFTEASQGNNDKVANLISPCLDLTTVPNPEISFAYHMLGTTMGTLRLQASINGGYGWSTLWSRSGSQGSNWQTKTISLADFTNAPGLLLRFNATTGSSWSSDIAIDDISIDPGPGTCYDIYEPNNTYLDAHGSTGPSLNFPNACLAAEENDYFLFVGSFSPYYVSVRGATGTVTGDYRISINQSGNTVTIETHPEGGSTTDTYLRLYDNDGTTLLASDNNSGVGLFSRIVYTFSGFIDLDQPEIQASLYSELDNIPNPFRETTIFVFSLEQEQQVNLKIFDVNGKVVAQPLSNAAMMEGAHQIEFDAGHLSPGVYFYSLQSAENVQTKQMLIVR